MKSLLGTNRVIKMKKIAVDSMIFIYHFEQNGDFSESVLKILSGARDGGHKLITSTVSIIETLSAPKYAELDEVVAEIRTFFEEAEFLEVLVMNGEIALETARLRRENPALRTSDAIQLATAIVAGAEVFITGDTKLKNIKIRGLEIKLLEPAHST